MFVIVNERGMTMTQKMSLATAEKTLKRHQAFRTKLGDKTISEYKIMEEK